MSSSDPYYVSRDSGQGPAKTWVSNQSSTLHRAFATPSRFNDQRAEFNPKKRSDDNSLRSHTDHFCQVMDIYQRNAKEKPIVNFDVRGTHSWDEVMRVAKNAEEKYIADGKGARGAGRKVIRTMGDYAPAGNPWLGLIPNGDYTSVICGGLKLIFSVAARLSERRIQIFEAFGDVPETIQMAQRYRETFPSDTRLCDLTTELYLSILTAIEAMTLWLVDKSALKQLKAIVLGSLADRSLDDITKLMEKQLKSLQGQIDYLRDSVVAQIGAATERMEPKLDILDSTTKSIKADTGHTQVAVKIIESGVNDMGVTVESMKSQVSTLADNTNTFRDSYDKHAMTIEAGIDELRQNGVQAQNGLLHVLQEHYRKAEWNQKKLQYAETEILHLKVELERARTPTNAPKPLVSREQLVDLLLIDPAMAGHDNEMTVRRGQAISPASQSRAQWLMRTSMFQTWLTSGRAQSLLVEGNVTAEALDRISSMSVCCAMLVNSLAEVEPAFTVHFYCGLHTASNDSTSGPGGLIRSLITQLLSFSISFDLTFIKSRKHRDQLSRHELDHLCVLFQSLVKQLPIDTVLFCVIDGVSLYEKYEWQQDTCFVIRKLREMVEDDDLGAVFKLLVTSPCTTRYVKGQLAAEDRLIIPRDAGTDKQVFTERQAVMQTRRAMSSRQSSHGQSDEDEGYGEEDFDDGNF